MTSRIQTPSSVLLCIVPQSWLGLIAQRIKNNIASEQYDTFSGAWEPKLPIGQNKGHIYSMCFITFINNNMLNIPQQAIRGQSGPLPLFFTSDLPNPVPGELPS
jgi:hypothetical protein